MQVGVVWSVVVHAANLTDGVMDEKVVEPLQGYLHRMQNILANQAYKQVFTDWVYKNMLGVEIDISTPPPCLQGFVPVKWRWVGERTERRCCPASGWHLKFTLDDWIKIMRKPQIVLRLGCFVRIAS